MKKWQDIVLEWKEKTSTILSDIRHQVKTFNKPKNEALFQIQVINKIKEKRNNSKSAVLKKDLQGLIDELEKEYKKIAKDY